MSQAESPKSASRRPAQASRAGLWRARAPVGKHVGRLAGCGFSSPAETAMNAATPTVVTA